MENTQENEAAKLNEAEKQELIYEAIKAAGNILMTAFYACDLKHGLTTNVTNQEDGKMFHLSFTTKIDKEGIRIAKIRERLVQSGAKEGSEILKFVDEQLRGLKE